MDYREIAKDLLQRKPQLESAKKSLETEILMLEEDKYAAHTAAISDPSVTRGGSSRYEERLVNLIVLVDNAYFRKRIVERELKMIANGYEGLTPYEVDLLEIFYVARVAQPVEAVGAKYYKERSAVFADKKRALDRFTRSVYGVVHL